MKRIFWSILASVTFGSVVLAAQPEAAEVAAVEPPRFKEQYVMLYYPDITAAARFYGGVMGLTATLDEEWVKLYEVLPGSFIGVVREGGTAYHTAQEKNAVMVSLVTDDVDGWYARFKEAADTPILLEIYDSTSVPIRAFLVADPGGYTVEIFQWLR
jgi:catechol 2,3-dioxygenase-like lactoylglutathione lyase family enzyme